MSEHRPEVPRALKKKLRKEAGHKCANPGCANHRSQLHHIREWAVYKTHEGEHMIAVCASCHDAIHHGALTLSDEKLYEWKRIRREAAEWRGHVYVEPGGPLRLVIGSLAVETKYNELTLFDLGDTKHKLHFKVRGGEIMLFDAVVCSSDGVELLNVTDNYIRAAPRDGYEFKSVPGRVEFTAPFDTTAIPDWAKDQLIWLDPSIAESRRIVMFDIEVAAPGIVRIRGVWVDGGIGIAITSDALGILRVPGSELGPRKIVGGGGPSKPSIATWTGPLHQPLFEWISERAQVG